MIFGGFQKLTLLDFPGKVACILFTKGCNFSCPFCHNAALVRAGGEEESITSDEVISFLKKRQGVLEGVSISGGEPLLHDELIDFIKEVKKLGYFVKLDTNGSFPKKMKELVVGGLVDYVAMDIKNSFDKYPSTAGCAQLNIADIEESIDFLLGDRVEYEFRTTVVNELHTVEDIENISKRIKGAKKYFIQNFVDSGNILGENLHPVDEKKLEKMQNIAEKYVKTASVR